MIVRTGTGWQYALADLSLILFMVTASALAQAGGPKAALPPPPPLPPIAAAMRAEPVAVWSAGRDAPPLADWLGQVGADSRLEVSVVVRYGAGAGAGGDGGGREAAMAQAAQLVAAGGARARDARILVEPGARTGASVSLTYASELAALAR
ncbi:hypothetical protein GGQ88_003162 [Novosphingobium hassiacum]|uniref:Uncharacterized protein n=1 Tax=Novosphingobium hassiacum TaxID=173676 RepID=A0A7W6EWZ1_9SPHN|nr:hypothetical protein [Novosphingobium hassiacum]MBB3861872.1 hypothetical protein [Novosphingobium hassiacum]